MKQSLLLAFILFISTHAGAQQTEFCGLKNTSFREGEKIVYKVYYNMGNIWVGAGYATFTAAMEMLNGKKVYHVIGDGKTVKSYEWFYKVRDKYESFIDMETMLPLKFIRNVNEGGYKLYNLVNFNHAKGEATSTQTTIPIPDCIQDVLSTIYYARNIDYSKYKPGDKIPFSMYLDDQVHNLYIRYLGKERITTRYGSFNTIKIAPLLVEGSIFKGGERMTVWVSDDANHIPVRVNSPILVGSVKVDLIAYDKLRNSFTSKLKKKLK